MQARRTNPFALVAVGLFCLLLGVGVSMVGEASTPHVYTGTDVLDAFVLIGLLMLLSFAAGIWHVDP